MKKKRLTIENRMLIAELLRKNYLQQEIAEIIGVSPSTISREIKNRRTHNKSTEICHKTNRYPFICSNCTKKTNCRKRKYYYGYEVAQKDYEIKLVKTRIGIDMTIDEIDYWNDYFNEMLRKKNQPITHIFNNVKDSFPKSIQTFYKYVHRGYFPSINDEMLARSFSYKKRKKKKEINQAITIHRNSKLKRGRTIKDFESYIEINPKVNIVEMDLVIGKADDERCLLTLYFRKTKYMLIYLVDKYDPDSITKVFDYFKKTLGEDLFKKMFAVILTDNGWEFSKPDDIEINYETGEQLVNLFYTDPYSSWQKGALERNRQFIRYIIPKGISFDNLNKKNVTDIYNNINNVQRKSLKYLTPYSKFHNEFGPEVCSILKIKEIKPNKVDLSYRILNK